MTLETVLIIVWLVLTVVCGVGYRYLSDHVTLRYKDQRIPRKGLKK